MYLDFDGISSLAAIAGGRRSRPRAGESPCPAAGAVPALELFLGGFPLYSSRLPQCLFYIQGMEKLTGTSKRSRKCHQLRGQQRGW